MRTLRSALLGVGVMLACFVPPIVHFVSGPLSPAIAGFVVGLRTRCQLRQAEAIAALMGVMLLAIAGIVVAVVSAFLPGLLPGINLTVAALGALGAFLYVFWLAMLGAWAGGAFARRPERRAPEAVRPNQTETGSAASDAGSAHSDEQAS